MKPRDIIALTFGSIAFTSINVIAFVFDGAWIRDAMIINTAVITAIITYYYKNHRS